MRLVLFSLKSSIMIFPYLPWPCLITKAYSAETSLFVSCGLWLLPQPLLPFGTRAWTTKPWNLTDSHAILLIINIYIYMYLYETWIDMKECIVMSKKIVSCQCWLSISSLDYLDLYISYSPVSRFFFQLRSILVMSLALLPSIFIDETRALEIPELGISKVVPWPNATSSPWRSW